MFITKAHLSRRAALRGLGISISLPFLDSMIPAQTPLRNTVAAVKPRFVAIEMVHGAAGSTALGRSRNYWSPAKAGGDFEFTPTLKPLESLRQYVTIVSNTELHNAMSLVPDEDGPMADHARSSSVFLTAAHPNRMAEGDIRSGPSVDQIYAQRIGHETPLASMQLCIEDNSVSGSCGYGYSCAYTNTISWASPTKPLPMERSPRKVFQRMFASIAIAGEPGPEGVRNGSILDRVPDAAARLVRRLGIADRSRVNEYLNAVREIELRIQRVENHNSSATRPRADTLLSVPDSFDEHVGIMFDLQVLAFRADITRVISFKLGADRSQRVYAESGVTTPFHALSHHRETPERIEEFARLNQYHVGKVARFLESLRGSPDGDGNLLDHSIVLYGSPMGDSHIHEHKFLPLFLAGKANGAVRGNRHIICPEETPMANVLVTVLHRLGVEADRVGDSSGEVPI